MDSLCEQIDKLTIEYIEEFGHLLACKQLIEETMKQGYFNLSRARVIMGVNNLSYLQYSENDSMVAGTKVIISSSPFTVDKTIDKEHTNDAIKWFGLLTPQVLKQSQKSFQTSIDLVLETCRRQDNILNLQIKIKDLLKEKHILSTKENINENKIEEN